MGLECGYRCHEIGGPWIAENPDCPIHGKNADALLDVLRERLSLSVSTDTPSYTGYVRLKVKLKLDGEVIAQDSCPLPDIGRLKRAEYRDY